MSGFQLKGRGKFIDRSATVQGLVHRRAGAAMRAGGETLIKLSKPQSPYDSHRGRHLKTSSFVRNTIVAPPAIAAVVSNHMPYAIYHHDKRYENPPKNYQGAGRFGWIRLAHDENYDTVLRAIATRMRAGNLSWTRSGQ